MTWSWVKKTRQRRIDQRARLPERLVSITPRCAALFVLLCIIFVHVLPCNERNIPVCCKFTQLHSHQILLKSVNIWLSYCEKQKGELFWKRSAKVRCTGKGNPWRHFTPTTAPARLSWGRSPSSQSSCSTGRDVIRLLCWSSRGNSCCDWQHRNSSPNVNVNQLYCDHCDVRDTADETVQRADRHVQLRHWRTAATETNFTAKIPVVTTRRQLSYFLAAASCSMCLG